MSEERKRIKVQVIDKIARLVDDTQFIVCDNDDYDVEFTFDKQWEAYPVKTVVFVYGESVVEKVISDNVCEGVAIRGATICGIGVYSGDLSTTTPAFLNCKQSIRDLAKYKTPVAPSEDVYAQIIELLNQYIAEVNKIVAKAVEDYLIANPPGAAFSPIVSVAPIEGGHRVTITDINEAHTFDVMNGAKGERGKAGYTPQRGVDYWTPEDISEVQEYAQNVAAREASKAVVDLVDPTLKNHDRRIEQIERHISNDYILTDDSVAYTKPIDPDVCPYAQLNSISGMTYKCNNLLKSLSTYANTTVENGVVKQITADSRTEFNFKIQKHTGTVIGDLLAISPTITSLGVVAMTFTKSSDFERIVFGVNGSQRDTTASAYVSNLIDGKVYTLSFNVTNITQGSISWRDVMLNEGSTALPFEPFYEGVRNSKVTEIKNYGANLFSASMVVGGYVSGSGQFSVSVGGENSFIAKCKPNTTYTLSKLNTTIVRVAGFVSEPTNKAQGEMLKELANNTTVLTFTTRNNEYIAVFYRNNTNEANTNENVIASIMLNEGATALTYKPYREPISYPIPAEIQALEGYGVGMSSANTDYNYIDFERKVYRVQVEIEEGGDAPMVMYVPEPYEVDVSAYLKDFDNIIEVEGGGSLEFVNEYKNAIPSAVKYLLKEESAV